MVKVRRPVVKKIKWGAPAADDLPSTLFIPTLKFLRRSYLQSFYQSQSKQSKTIS